MQVTTIRFLKRVQVNQFEPEELEATAVLSEGENPLTALTQLKSFVLQGLGLGLVEESAPGIPTESAPGVPMESAPGVKATVVEPVAFVSDVKEKAAPKAKAKAKGKDTLACGTEIPPVIKESASVETPSVSASSVVGTVDTDNVTHVQSETPKASSSVAKGIVTYDSRVKEQRSRFATYLGTNYKNWKTAHSEDKIKAFSLGLQGKPFENSRGEMLESFKAELEAFFGHAK